MAERQITLHLFEPSEDDVLVCRNCGQGREDKRHPIASGPSLPEKIGPPEAGSLILTWSPYETLEEQVVAQAVNLSKLPFVLDHIALMPDAHAGYGMPIGGVLPAVRAVVPYAIGVDIGCGVNLVATDLTGRELGGEREGEGVAEDAPLRKILAQILRDVPVGNGPHGNRDEPMNGEALAELMGYDGVPEVIHTDWFMTAMAQVGTLGGGNHFIELQVDDEDRVYVMLHSGSRALGKRICDHAVGLAREENARWYSALPDKDLAYLPMGTRGFDAYWDAMTFALRYAEVNRDRMLATIGAAINRTASTGLVPVADCHHNYAAWEHHYGQDVIVHRKGAVRARAGEDVLIPGSMGTASYWGKGLGNAAAFETCQHGAGRAMSRGKARAQFSLETMQRALSNAGNLLYTLDAESVRDEAPGAYKDIESVMAHSADLVTPYKRLLPIGTVKG